MMKSVLVITVLTTSFLAGCTTTVNYPSQEPEQPPVIQETIEVHIPQDPDAPIIYCSQCGVIAGQMTKCPNYTSHNFKTSPAGTRIICNQCGVVPANQPTRCPNYSSHNFKEYK